MTHTFYAMNTVCSTKGLTEEKRQEVEAWMKYVEQKVSRFLPDSDVSRVNRSDAPLIFTSMLLYRLLWDAERYRKETEGIFTPYLGKEISRLGYCTSFEKISRNEITAKEAGFLAESVPAFSVKCILPQKSSRKYRPLTIQNDKWVDLGGIAKGWSAQIMAEWLQAEGIAEGIINAGGDIVCWGKNAKHKQWCVGVAHPSVEQQDIAHLWLRRTAGIATSGVGKRCWKKDGATFHHLLDPRTRVSSTSDVLQATVLGPDLTIAEVYAKCLLILGSWHGVEWLRNKRPDLAYILVKENGEIECSANMEEYCLKHEVERNVI